MNATTKTAVLLLALAAAATAGDAVTARDLAGIWAGTLSHDGETQPLALELVPDPDGKLEMLAWLPAVHLVRAPFGKTLPKIEGDQVTLGPFHLAYDGKAGTLSGTMPDALVPVYKLPLSLHRVERFDAPPRPAPGAPVVRPVWTFEAGAAQWAGGSFEAGVLFTGGDDGKLHALDAATGKEEWVARIGGAIRTRPTIAAGSLYIQADDGHLYKISAASGQPLWRVQVNDAPIERLPFDNPKSRFDRFGSDVTVAAGRLYLGTHGGKVLALEPETGAPVWSFSAGDAVLSAPAVADGRVYAGSYDHFVYALDAATGRLVWKRDTLGAVVNTPTVSADGTRLVVGTRAYDLLGLEARTGEIAWKRYIWSSWVDSTATIKDGVAYVGSSDAAAAYAFDARTGQPLWKTDVYGWAWGQPAVTDTRVYVGASSQVGYLAQHDGGVMALDRKTGRTLWRFPAPAPAAGAYGFAGSPAVGGGRVYVTGLDGRVLAFEL
jgi:outer membrane protein assembly factor BamB